MQSMSLLLRQSLLRPSVKFMRRCPPTAGSQFTTATTTTTTTTTSSPSHTAPSIRPITSLRTAAKFHRLSGYNKFSICARCQFRAERRLYSVQRSGDSDTPSSSSPEEDIDAKKKKERDGNEANIIRDNADSPMTESFRVSENPALNSHSSGAAAAAEAATQKFTQDAHVSSSGNSKLNPDGLPSEAESRRSDFSKRFSTVMDNLQSNVFIAGQRLNDLTGYSSIEKLKQDILMQGTYFLVGII